MKMISELPVVISILGDLVQNYDELYNDEFLESLRQQQLSNKERLQELLLFCEQQLIPDQPQNLQQVQRPTSPASPTHRSNFTMKLKPAPEFSTSPQMQNGFAKMQQRKSPPESPLSSPSESKKQESKLPKLGTLRRKDKEKKTAQREQLIEKKLDDQPQLQSQQKKDKQVLQNKYDSHQDVINQLSAELQRKTKQSSAMTPELPSPPAGSPASSPTRPPPRSMHLNGNTGAAQQKFATLTGSERRNAKTDSKFASLGRGGSRIAVGLNDIFNGNDTSTEEESDSGSVSSRSSVSSYSSVSSTKSEGKMSFNPKELLGSSLSNFGGQSDKELALNALRESNGSNSSKKSSSSNSNGYGDKSKSLPATIERFFNRGRTNSSADGSNNTSAIKQTKKPKKEKKQKKEKEKSKKQQHQTNGSGSNTPTITFTGGTEQPLLAQ